MNGISMGRMKEFFSLPHNIILPGHPIKLISDGFNLTKSQNSFPHNGNDGCEFRGFFIVLQD